MKIFCIFLFVLSIMVSSCVKENTPTTPGTQTVDTTMALTRYMGTFMNGPYGSVRGAAKIYLLNGQFLFALENVTISNGPDLHVYLSKEPIPVNYIDLGRLQSVSGNQVYSIMGSPDFSQYRYALIHCKRYNHLFGSAELQ